MDFPLLCMQTRETGQPHTARGQRRVNLEFSLHLGDVLRLNQPGLFSASFLFHCFLGGDNPCTQCLSTCISLQPTLTPPSLGKNSNLPGVWLLPILSPSFFSPPPPDPPLNKPIHPASNLPALTSASGWDTLKEADLLSSAAAQFPNPLV